MDPVKEFPTFLDRLYAAFPDILEWVKQNSPDIALTQGAWAQTLKPCTLEECNKVLSDWINAVHPPPKGYERSQVALIIRQSVMQDRDEARRAKAEKPRGPLDHVPDLRGSSKDIPSIAHALARALDLKSKGANDQVIELEIKKMLPAVKDNFDEPRYRCPTCRDRGVVCVWNPDEMDKIRDGKLSRGCILHQSAVACSCTAGDKIYNGRASASSKGVQIARLSHRHCRVEQDPFHFVSQESVGVAWSP